MGFTGPESGSSWLVCAAVSAFLTSCCTSRYKLSFHLYRLRRSAQKVTSLPDRFDQKMTFAGHLLAARERRRPPANGVKSSFRSRSAFFIGWGCSAVTAATKRSVWINDIRSHLPSGPVCAADGESRKWRCALTRCTQECTEFLERPRQSRCLVHHIWIFHWLRGFDHGSSVDVQVCDLSTWTRGTYNTCYWRDTLTVPN